MKPVTDWDGLELELAPPCFASRLSHMLFLTPRINNDIINKDDGEQVQTLFDHLVR